MSLDTSKPLVLASAGIGVIGVSFGMARYGFGLLAPEIRATFSLSSAAVGLLGAGSYLAYIASSIGSGLLAARLGARAVVTAGGLCAITGMLVAALAATPAVLFAGLLVAGSSAGLVFPPLSDVVQAHLAPRLRGRVLAAISSGTGWGVALAALLALLAGSGWRTTWLLFAAVGLVTTAWAVAVLPGRGSVRAASAAVRLRWSWFVCPRSRQLLLGSLVLGLASSVFWTFAVDRLVGESGLSAAQGRGFFALVGIASIGGSLGGDAIRRLGPRPTFALVLGGEALALGLLGLVPASIEAALAAAVLFGFSYNAAVALQVIWSSGVFRERPSAGLAALMVMQAVGLLLGPPLLGAAADQFGFAAVFGAAAASLLAVAISASPPAELDASPDTAA